MAVITTPRPFPSYWLLLVVPIFLSLNLGAHAMADLFLEFVTVETGSEGRLFLGSAPGGVASYSLLGDPTVLQRTVPSVLDQSFLLSLDRIAQGASRFSIVPAQYFHMQEEEELLNGLVLVQPFLIWAEGMVMTAGRTMPRRLNVTCNFTTDAYTPERWKSFTADATNYGLEPPLENENALSIKTMTYFHGEVWSSNTTSIQRHDFLSIPNCDYETDVAYKSAEKSVDAEQEWKVILFSNFQRGPTYDAINPEPFGVRDEEGHLRWYLQFSDNETELPFSRESGWQNGRSVRDNLVLVIGLSSTYNATHWHWYEPYVPLDGGIELEVEYSVLSGPGKDNAFDTEGRTFYTLSSWSHVCPWTNSSSGELTTLQGNKSGENAGGCILDVELSCEHPFPQDRKNAAFHNGEQPACIPLGIESTYLAGIDVDRSMLAAYAGIATRNGAINAQESYSKPGFRINSIAAAYVVTRESVNGRIATEGVKASFGIEYILLILLPLWLILPLLIFLKRDAGPIPQSIWQIMLFGSNQESVTSQLYSTRQPESFPPCPSELKCGFVENYDKDPHLGLGSDAFVPMEDASPRVQPVYDEESAKRKRRAEEGDVDKEDQVPEDQSEVTPLPPPTIAVVDELEDEAGVYHLEEEEKKKKPPRHHHGHKKHHHRKKKKSHRRDLNQEERYQCANQV